MADANTTADATLTDDERLSEYLKAAMYDLSQNVDSLRTSYPLATKSLLESDAARFNRLKDFLLSNSLGRVAEDNPHSIVPVSTIPREHWQEYRRLTQDLDKTRRGHVSLSRSFLVSLVSVFDVFMASVFRFILLKVPALLHNKEAMPFEKLSSFDSIENAKLYVINREIDFLLRDSRSEQFKWIENKLKIDLRTDKDLWEVVVELEQRRNAFVHTDGLVTESFIEQCKRNGVELPKDIKVGDLLLNLEDYFDQCCRAMLEIGIRVSQQVWRQLLKKDSKADTEFLNFCFFRILNGEYSIAIRLLRAAHEQLQFKYQSQDAEYKNLLNLAQAYKWSGEVQLCKETLQSRDFSATSAVLRLAKACLEENWSDALRLFKEVGPNCPEMEATYYRDWPIFRGLRENTEFPQVFEQVFGMPLFVAEIVKSEVDAETSKDTE